jgi:alpha-L-rhamnosidase
MREELEAVWAGFANPPDEARPRAWWHWMDGNVDPEGIRLDLEWLHDVGVRGVQMFDGGMGTPLVVLKLVWSETLTAGGGPVEVALATVGLQGPSGLRRRTAAARRAGGERGR